ncbi:WD40 repeat-like protein [Gyrodon lividus]|nr:WD40 repeat-like protein [Gyrodon lividus]
MLAFAPSIRPAIIDALNEDYTIPTKVLVEQMRRLLQAPISSIQSSFLDPVLIVIDSLDECDDQKMVNEVVILLANFLRTCHWPLKILFTSRAEPHIVQTFQQSDIQSMTRSLQLQDFSVDDDVKSYLLYSFEGIRQHMGTMSESSLPWPAEEDIQTIVQKSAGLFIFATTVVGFVGDKHSSPASRLQSVLQGGASAASSSVYSDLDTLYFDALRTIPDAYRTRLVLGFVVFAFSPLSTRGLNTLLGKFQIDASFVIKSLCSVLVTSDTENDGAVRIYHTSFRDFLTTSHRSRQYFADAITYHRIIAQACLEAMIRHLTADMCKLGDPSVLNSEIENLNELCKLRIDEGVRYACRWFSYHFSHVPSDTGLNDTLILCVQGFARGYLLNWIEVLSLMGELESAIISLREIADWLKSSSKPHQETLALLQDAERLVLMFFDPIQQAALQVYYAVPYAPKRIQLRTTYQHELTNKFTITSGLDDHWSPCLRSVLTGSTFTSLAVSASGRLIASAGGTPGVQMWDSLTGKNVGHFTGSGALSSCPVVFSTSGDYVAVGYETGAIDVWDVATGQQLLDPDQTPHQAYVSVLTFSWNSSFVASGSTDATVHIWDISTRSLRHSLTYHQGPIRCLLFSSTDNLIASGSEDTSVITSDTKSGQLVRKMKGHNSKINSISFSTDSSSIASGSDDQIVRLWDTQTGVCLRTYTGAHKKPVTHVWITTDNKHLVSVCDMNIYMWELGSRKSPQHIWSVDHFYRKMVTLFPAWYAKLVVLFPSRLFGRFFEMDDGTPLCPVFSPNGWALPAIIFSSFWIIQQSHGVGRGCEIH